MNFSDVRLWIFDCDGVLLDSNGMKTAAFADIVSDYPAACSEPFLAFQRTAFGMSRFRTLDTFFSNYLGRQPEVGEKDAMLERFGQYCRQNYPRQPVTDGTTALLKWLKAREVPAYVASGSEQEELRSALTGIGLAPYFRDILGSPGKKHDLVTDILKREPSARAKDTLFLGDAKADFEAADGNGITFIQVERYAADPEGMALLRSQKNFPCVATLADIPLHESTFG